MRIVNYIFKWLFLVIMTCTAVVFGGAELLPEFQGKGYYGIAGTIIAFITTKWILHTSHQDIEQP